jgi:hypothetical protein
MKASPWSILLFGGPLLGCRLALGLGDLKEGPDPNDASDGATMPPEGGTDGGGDSPANSNGGTCGGATCATSERCENGQCCPVVPGDGGCVVFPSCGCTADQNCARIGGGPEQCVAGGTALALQNCGDSTECRPGLLCADNLCDPPCDGVCTTANYYCLPQDYWSGDGGLEPLGYSVCEPHCNPVAALITDGSHAPCNPGQRCDVNPNGNGVTYCNYPAGGGIQGAACSTSYDCAANYVCTAPQDGSLAPGNCQAYCDLGGATTCPSGTTCQAFSPKARYDRNVEVGSCQ